MFEKVPGMIDCHFHIRGLNEGRLAPLLSVSEEIRRRLAMTNVCVLALPAWDAASVGQNILCLAYKALYPNAYAHAGLDHYAPGTDRTREGYLAQVKLYDAMGFDGMKNIESKPSARKALGVGLDDERYADYFAYVEQKRIPVLWHVADPEEFWSREKCSAFAIAAGWCYDGEGFTSKEHLYAETERVLQRHPALNAVFAHLYFMGADMPRLRKFLKDHPSVRIDVTPGSEMYFHFAKDREGWREFFIEHADRVLFGTDNGWGDENSAAQKVIEGCTKVLLLDAFFSSGDVVNFWGDIPVRGIDLPAEALKPIYRDNFLLMHHNQPARKLNLALAADYARDLYQRIERMPELTPAQKQQLLDATLLLEQKAAERKP